VFKVAVRGLFAHKARFASTFIAVILGISFLSGTLVLTDTIKGTFNDLFADVNRGTDAVVRGREKIEGEFGDSQRQRLDESLVDVVRGVDGVAVAEPTVNNRFVQIVDSDGKAIGNPGMGAPTFGRNWTDNKDLNPFSIAEGHAPEADGQVVIDRGAAKKGHLKVGDTIKLIVPKTLPQPFSLVGIATFGTADSTLGATTAMLTLADAQRYIGEPGKVDQIRVVAKDGVSQEEVTARIQAAMPPGVEAITGAQQTAEDQNEVSNSIGTIGLVFSAFAFVAVIVGGFVIYNTFSIITAQRTREMALLRAVGASRAQVLVSIAAEALIVGVVGSIVGLGLGLLVAGGLKGLMNSFGFTIPATGLVVTTQTLLVGFLVGTIVTLVAGIAPAVRGARVPPIAAMRDVAIERPPRRSRLVVGALLFGLGFVEILRGALATVSGAGVAAGTVGVLAGTLLLGPWAAPPLGRVLGAPIVRARGVTGEIARENAMRNPRRTTSAAAALLIGVGVVSLFTILLSSIRTSIFDQIDRTFTGSVTVSAGGGFGGGGLSPALAQQVKQLPEVADVTALRFGVVKREDGSTQQLVAIDPASATKVVDLDVAQGDISTLGDDGVAVWDKKAEQEHWNVGDAVTLKFIETGDHRFTIKSIFRRNDITGSMVVSTSTFDEDMPASLDAFVFVKFKDGVSFDQGRAAVTAVAKPFPNAKVQDQQELKNEFASRINLVLGLMTVLLALAIVIALMGISNTLRLSVLERTRELGLLRAVGMTRAQVRTLSEDQLIKFAPPVGLLIFILVLGALAGVIAAARPARRAAKLDVLQAIATE
jgi:putative ABC transport system permease protein